MNSHIDSLHKLQLASEAGSGVFGKSIKDSQVLLVVMKYGVLFGELVALSEDQDDEMVFARFVIVSFLLVLLYPCELTTVSRTVFSV